MPGPSVVADARVTPRVFPRRVREAVLTAHIMISVGLLGDSAGFLAVAIRANGLDDPVRLAELGDVLDMFSAVFGIPLSFGAILTDWHSDSAPSGACSGIPGWSRSWR
jgi:hypothetical protein